jgi:hypothetical protein
VDGELKNLIFAADGPKPRIVLRDAVNSVIEIVENADHCLVYDRPLGPDGLTWQALVDWWQDQYDPDADNDLEAGRRLHLRLQGSLQSPPEKLVLKTYAAHYGEEHGFNLPALVPRDDLHYDPYTKAELGPEGEVLARQRMDYLMLFPDQSRVVIEVDGRQHYSSGAKDQFSDPGRYAEMVREDRALRLRGYEVYRFGEAEFAGDDAVERVNEFFEALLVTACRSDAGSPLLWWETQPTFPSTLPAVDRTTPRRSRPTPHRRSFTSLSRTSRSSARSSL